VARARAPFRWRDRGGAGDVAREAQRLGVDEAALAADAPVVGEMAARHGLAHGGAAEDQGLEQRQAGVRGHVGVEAALQAACVEQDRLLGEPVEGRACARVRRA
jgi:hypothetical protein